MISILSIYVIIILLISFFEDEKIELLKYRILFLLMLLITLAITTCVDSIDYNGYKIMYTSVISVTNYNSDVLFNILILFHKRIFNNFTAFYSLIGLVNVFLLSLVINQFENNSKKAFFCILYFSFFFILKDCIQIRNALAIKLFLISMHYYFNKRWGVFLFFYLVSILVHNSLLVFIPCFFLYKKHISNIFIVILIVFFLICYLKIKGLFHLVFFNVESSNSRLFTYLAMGNQDVLSTFHFYKLLCYLIIFSIFRKEFDDKTNFFYWCIILGYAIRILFSDISLLTGRLAENFYIGELYVFTYIFGIDYKKSDKIILRLFALAYFFINLNMLFKNLDFQNVYKTLFDISSF